MALRRPRLPWIPAFAGITRREAAMTGAGVAGAPNGRLAASPWLATSPSATLLSFDPRL